jgi:single-stranded DNA-specific DHH superfamily exonuclease
LIAQGFLDKASSLNLPIVWIDHHLKQQPIDDILYLNPLMHEPKSNEPVSYWAYNITKNKNDDWIAFLGCLADWYIPDFANNVMKKYPDLINEEQLNKSEKALYESKFGFIVKLLSFALKDRTSNVVNMLKLLVNISTPYELLEQNNKTKQIYHRFKQINRHYTRLIEKAKSHARSKLLFFQYGGSLSLSAELSNELYYNFPNRVIVVAYLKGEKANVSIRGNTNVRDIIIEAIKGLDATGGGHEHACGATVKVEDLPLFRERLIKLIRSKKL